MPEWIELVIALVTGGALHKGFDWLMQRGKLRFDREARLEHRIEVLEARIEKLAADNGQLVVENTKLKIEVDDLLEAAGKPPKYELEVVIRPKTQ